MLAEFTEKKDDYEQFEFRGPQEFQVPAQVDACLFVDAWERFPLLSCTSVNDEVVTLS